MENAAPAGEWGGTHGSWGIGCKNSRFCHKYPICHNHRFCHPDFATFSQKYDRSFCYMEFYPNYVSVEHDVYSVNSNINNVNDK